LSENAGSGINFMSDQIIGLQDWLQTPAGQYLLAWEQSQLQASVVDIFGYHALQLGLSALHGLRDNRMPHQWLAVEHAAMAHGVSSIVLPSANLVTDFSALPFPSCSLDLLVLPHSLELSADPHATLREAERVLVPDGKIVICGLNPVSLWGWRQWRAKRLRLGGDFLPEQGEFIGYWRLRDWLRLLGFEVETGQFGCYRPALQSEQWLQRWAWMDRAGPRWWPIMGAAYFVVAVKRVRGMRLLGPTWKAAPVRASAPVSVVRKH
jgi:SAM-dependent methyltransferase